MNQRIIHATAILLLFSAVSSAQTETVSSASAPPAQGAASAPGVSARGQTASVRLGPPLKENVTLSVKGAYINDTPVDFSCTGVGPQWVKNSSIDSATMPSTTLQFKGAISETKDGYFLDFSLGAKIPLNTYLNTSPGASLPASATTFHNYFFSSSVNLKPGQPVVVLDNNGKTITITLTKPNAP